MGVSGQLKPAGRRRDTITSASRPKLGTGSHAPAQTSPPLITHGAGLTVRWKSIKYRWLARRHPHALIAIVDEATGRAVARLAPSDSRYENMLLLRSYLEIWGRPLQIQTDPNTLFTERSRDNGGSQIGRALQELDITWSETDRSWHEGYAEWFFYIAREVLCKGLSSSRISTAEGANRYLRNIYLPIWNDAHWATSSVTIDSHRPLPPKPTVDESLAHVTARVVTPDLCVRLGGHLYRIPTNGGTQIPHGSTVRIEKRIDGTIYARYDESYYELETIGPTRKTLPVGAAVKRRRQPKRPNVNGDWMKGFLQRPEQPLWRILERG